MIELSNTTVQTLAVGESMTFDKVIIHSGCGECHRPNTGSVKMKAHGIYGVYFAANVTNTASTATVELSMQAGGETLPETTMEYTPSTAGSASSVSRATLIKNCCGDYDRITITNTGTTAITVGADPVLIVRRLS